MLDRSCSIFSFIFFFNDTATTEIYTLSLHDALPICAGVAQAGVVPRGERVFLVAAPACREPGPDGAAVGRGAPGAGRGRGGSGGGRGGGGRGLPRLGGRTSWSRWRRGLRGGGWSRGVPGRSGFD